ncbi:MAG: 30S ribosomal protein S17e [Candidatus Altiarchaeota archaeon]|nr:30S ribosomal protein S17e [Candidatus Altiarchaeota archaeon]
MGNIRIRLVKRTANELVEKHPERFGKDFDKNKLAVDELLTGQTKRLRNHIAGYVTTIMK